MGNRPGTLGAVSGLLAALALPPFHLWPLVFVALVPLGWAIARDVGGRAGAVRAGLAFGALFYGLLLHWVPFTLQGLPGGVVPGLLLLLLLTGIGGLQGLALREWIVRRRIPPFLALPLLWSGTELLLEWAGPLAFPWLPLALALTPRPELAGIAEWVGVGGVSLWITAVNGGIVGALDGQEVRARGAAGGRRPVRQSVWIVSLLFLLLALPSGWGWWRAGTLPLSTLPPLLLVQLDLSRPLLLRAELRDPAIEAGIERVLAGLSPSAISAGDAAPVLAVFPEAPLSAPWNPEVEGRARNWAARLAMPILWGTHYLTPREGEREPAFQNAILLLDPARAEAEVLHRKVRLVPGVEAPGLSPGPRGVVREVGGIRLGMLICFEAAFGRDARHLRRMGAELLVNPTNDGWFLPEGGAAALAQHRAHLVLRAVEGRIGAVRSSLGGELLVVEPSGRIAASRPAGSEGTLLVRPRTTDLQTGAVRYGESLKWIGLLLLAAGFLRRPRAGVE